ncbi:MAG: DUF1993 domain-containing protein [Proteobacteria bacterium]|nr:DUF1993 domain-containing protein [Pseudomonadota bacterium]
MLYEITLPQFKKTLLNLSKILDKANAHAQVKKFDFTVLLNARLAPDQFPLVRQIQIACDTAKLGAARLSGKDAPTHDDQEKTFEDVQKRIKETINYLETISAKDFAQSETKRITQPRWEGKYLTGFDYVNEHVLPNLYFHVTTAYSILRHNGVDIGKKDYLGELPFKN